MGGLDELGVGVEEQDVLGQDVGVPDPAAVDAAVEVQVRAVAVVNHQARLGAGELQRDVEALRLALVSRKKVFFSDKMRPFDNGFGLRDR